MNIVLWVVQILVGLGFLAAGIPKATQPIPQLAKRLPWAADIPAWQVRAIGGVEVLGALGVVLPALIGIAPWLTIAAAVGLAVVMVGAVVFHLARSEASKVVAPLVLFLLAAFIAVGRWKLATL